MMGFEMECRWTGWLVDSFVGDLELDMPLDLSFVSNFHCDDGWALHSRHGRTWPHPLVDGRHVQRERGERERYVWAVVCRSELESMNSELNERLTSLKADNASLTTALTQVLFYHCWCCCRPSRLLIIQSALPSTTTAGTSDLVAEWPLTWKTWKSRGI